MTTEPKAFVDCRAALSRQSARAAKAEQQVRALVSENMRLKTVRDELAAALEHILRGALSLPRFAEVEARAALAKARGAR